VETSRRQFMLLGANITAAEENVRVHTLGFREGQATATELIDAQVALSVALTQRAAAAYEYDLALAQLLAASGRMNDYAQHIARADQRMSAP
jgi:outer membrane protein TolC